MNGLRNPYPPIVHIHVEGIACSTCEYAVEVVGVPPSLHNPLPSASGASVPVRIARSLSIECGNNGLRLNSRFVHGAKSEIDQLLRMAHRNAAPLPCGQYL
jgi:hypothetical protein